ncbi:MAG: hypothetical protein ACYCY1_11435 [Sulfuriferula sp.]
MPNTEILRNGFHCVDKMDIINTCNLSMFQIDKIRTLLGAIKQLVNDKDSPVYGLTDIALGVADEVHNDIDCLHERSEKAGVIGDIASAA